jgi:predicted kinase
VQAIAEWEDAAFGRLRPAFRQRARRGHVRECHGDLHLGNLTEFEGRTTPFDCLEFDAALRWTDVMSDVAFLAMDLRAHDLPRLAHRFVNAYVERCDAHDGLRVLRYYQVHRALVRAKVAALRDAQLASQDAGHAAQRRSLQHYLDVAHDDTVPAAPVLMLTHGYSGSGKTTWTQSLLERCGAIRLRADVERKRLFGLRPLERSAPELKPRLYGDAASRATQSRLRVLAALALRSGYSVIADATYLARAPRQAMVELAARLGVRAVILDFRAPASVLRQRVAQRAGDASEADLAVLNRQLDQAEPLLDDERALAYAVDTSVDGDAASQSAVWTPLLRGLVLPA